MTEPLVSADVDLRGLPWMRLDTSRLLDSDLFALSTGDEFKAAVALWCKSWTQMPGGSLPNDDRILAHLSGAGSRWKKVKDMALRGWVQCSDGRLYHAVVAEQAIAAWQERQEYREEIEAQNKRKREQREERAALMADLKAAGVHLAWNAPMAEVRASHANLSKPVTGTGAGQSQTSHGDSHGLDGTGEGRESKALRATAVPRTPEVPESPKPAAPTPTAAGRACRLMREAGCPSTNPSHPDLLAALAEGVTPEQLADTTREAIELGKSKPFAWAIATARGRRDEGASPVATGPPRPPQAQSKTLSAIQKLEAMKNGLAGNRTADGLPETALLGAGANAG